jgi:class 3 adenylate cyclase
MDLNAKFPGFKSAERPSVGLALIFDISGFTNFFNKPDIHFYMTDYINSVIDCVETVIWGGTDIWSGDTPEEAPPLIIKPIMRKFLGDGMLYVWEDDESKTLSNSNFKFFLINSLWNLQLNFKKINKGINEYIPIANLPKNIKIGMAQGSIFKLIENDGSVDCIGPCINLASRLVKYCPEINFVASARMNLNKKELAKYGYFKIIAKELKSFEDEIIIVDKKDYDKVNEVDRERLFEELEE